MPVLTVIPPHERTEDEDTRPYRPIRHLYNTFVRPHLPTRTGIANGVAIPIPVLDMTTHRPRYENRGVSALKALVRPGDCVVIVGGGLGVTPVWAARMAGSRGRVDVYECDADSVATVRETCHKNGVENRVTVHHERVGPDTNLPECDVLEVDCEGCELDLIPNLGIEPRVTIVEYHETHDTV